MTRIREHVAENTLTATPKKVVLLILILMIFLDTELICFNLYVFSVFTGLFMV